MRAWYIGCALGLQPGEEISIISVRSNIFRECGLLVGRRIASPVNGVRFSALAPFVFPFRESRSTGGPLACNQ